jgi:cytidylate kinase
MRAVTISREYGSGGGEIASRLARYLGWQLIDHEIVERVARELGTSVQEAEAYDEYAAGAFERVLNNMQYINPSLMAYAPPGAFYANETIYREAVNSVVKAAAARGHVVIVGRASQVLLAGQRDVLHVRIIAPLKKRMAYVMQREELDHTAAQSRIHKKDHERARYLELEHHRTSEDAHLYDIVLNTSHLDLDSAVEVIGLALQRKAKRLSAQTSELGPATGLSPYPIHPQDFHVSVN